MSELRPNTVLGDLPISIMETIFEYLNDTEGPLEYFTKECLADIRSLRLTCWAIKTIIDNLLLNFTIEICPFRKSVTRWNKLKQFLNFVQNETKWKIRALGIYSFPYKKRYAYKTRRLVQLYAWHKKFQHVLNCPQLSLVMTGYMK